MKDSRNSRYPGPGACGTDGGIDCGPTGITPNGGGSPPEAFSRTAPLPRRPRPRRGEGDRRGRTANTEPPSNDQERRRSTREQQDAHGRSRWHARHGRGPAAGGLQQRSAGRQPGGRGARRAGLGDADMLRIAAELGYSESAFLVPRGEREHDVRYFSPKAEVAFCGHATVATAVALAERDGPGGDLHTRPGRSGRPPADGGGRLRPRSPASRRTPRWRPPTSTRRWPPSAGHRRPRPGPAAPRRLRRRPPPGARRLHPGRLADLSYDFDRAGALMAGRTGRRCSWSGARPRVFHARDPFPPGGVVEDPATGAAAAAFGGYLASSAWSRTPRPPSTRATTWAAPASSRRGGRGPRPSPRHRHRHPPRVSRYPRLDTSSPSGAVARALRRTHQTARAIAAATARTGSPARPATVPPARRRRRTARRAAPGSSPRRWRPGGCRG